MKKNGLTIKYEDFNRYRLKKFYNNDNVLVRVEQYVRRPSNGLLRNYYSYVCEITYNENDKYKKETWYAVNNKRKLRTIYSKNGCYHRDHGPACIYYGAESERFKVYCIYYKHDNECRDNCKPFSYRIDKLNRMYCEKRRINNIVFTDRDFDDIIKQMKENKFSDNFFNGENLQYYEALLEIAKTFKYEDAEEQIIAKMVMLKLENSTTI